LDVGGTTIKAAVVDDSGRIVGHSVALPTEAGKGSQHGLQVMAEAIRRAAGNGSLTLDDVAAIGVATPGPLDIPAGVIIDTPNLPGWHNVPVRDFIERTFGRPTAFQNDANAAAVGEAWVGAGRGVRSMGLLTLGTGIGGGIVIDGRVLDGAHSHGGELGHIKIEMTNPRLCGCGQRGCLEAYASATAVVARTREALQHDAGHSTLHGVPDLSAKAVFDAATLSDGLAKTIVDDTARYLAIGAATLMHVIDPEVIVFAGGMTAAGPEFLEAIRRHVKQVAFPTPAARCAIRYSELGMDAGVIGAAGCARVLI
jgi:glucokinase